MNKQDRQRLAANKRNAERRRVVHQLRPCVACDEPFMPTRDDAITCSNRCRQRLFRFSHRMGKAAKQRLLRDHRSK
jgi:hypothetical protein